MSEEKKSQLVKSVFEDYEARSNIVGLFDLLLKIDRRVNPQFYASENKSEGAKRSDLNKKHD